MSDIEVGECVTTPGFLDLSFTVTKFNYTFNNLRSYPHVVLKCNENPNFTLTVSIRDISKVNK
jgi:hypothetical protein